MRTSDIDFLIIGATKGATTWLQRCLMDDPAIAMPGPELHYFSRAYRRGDDWYLSQFPQGAAGRIAGEKSNSYMEAPESASRILRANPNVRLVAQLRNPVDRAYSDYCMRYRRGEYSRDVARYLNPDDPTDPMLIARGHYARQLRAFYDLFPAENILITLFEDVAQDPASLIGRVRSFLGLPEEHPAQMVLDRVKDRRQPTVGPELRRLLTPLKPLVAPFRDSPTFKRVHALLASEIRYSPLTADVRVALARHYEPEVEALSTMIGRDLGAWMHGRRSQTVEPGPAAEGRARCTRDLAEEPGA